MRPRHGGVELAGAPAPVQLRGGFSEVFGFCVEGKFQETAADQPPRGMCVGLLMYRSTAEEPKVSNGGSAHRSVRDVTFGGTTPLTEPVVTPTCAER